MDATDARSTRIANWCSVLETVSRPVAPECEVRTVTGLYNAVRAPGEKRARLARTPIGRSRIEV